MIERYFPFIIISGFIGIFALIFFLSYLYGKKRTENLNKYAQMNGFTFTKDPTNPTQIDFINDFKIFNIGRSRKTKNIIQGKKNQISLTIFDYRYTVGGGKNSHTYNQTIIKVKLNTSVPNFYLGKENFFTKIGSKIGFNDINFETHKEFSDYYNLKGNHEIKIKQCFTTQILTFFEQNKFDFFILGHNNNMLFYKTGKRLKPEEINPRIEEIIKIIKLFDKGEY
jgi:hypothetical protein